MCVVFHEYSMIIRLASSTFYKELFNKSFVTSLIYIPSLCEIFKSYYIKIFTAIISCDFTILLSFLRSSKTILTLCRANLTTAKSYKNLPKGSYVEDIFKMTF